MQPTKVRCAECDSTLVSGHELAFAGLKREGRAVSKYDPDTSEYEFICHDCNKAWTRPAKEIFKEGIPANFSWVENCDFFIVSEIAAKLRVSEMTIYRYIKAGRLEAYKFGKEFRVTKEAVEKFLSNHEL